MGCVASQPSSEHSTSQGSTSQPSIPDFTSAVQNHMASVISLPDSAEQTHTDTLTAVHQDKEKSTVKTEGHEQAVVTETATEDEVSHRDLHTNTTPASTQIKPDVRDKLISSDSSKWDGSSKSGTDHHTPVGTLPTSASNLGTALDDGFPNLGVSLKFLKEFAREHSERISQGITSGNICH